jgi:hypothetical protein
MDARVTTKWFSEGTTYTLEDLFPPDIRQTAIQFLDFGHYAVNLALILALDFAGFADCHVDSQFDAATCYTRVGEPASHADSSRP